MRAAVLVKQVPDLRRGSVRTHPDGTIDRSSAPPITNPADLHAVAAAAGLADEVTAISMGPPTAEEALRDALTHGADHAYLLTDRAFAGSDTWATSNALAAALRHLGPFDLVVCGLTAMDGETGQVGPQVAERLGIPQVTGCEELTLVDGGIRARRIVEGGYETLLVPLPALVTVAETGFAPRYPTLPERRRAEEAPVVVLTASQLGLSDEDVGLSGSPTRVAHMELVALPTVDCRFVAGGFGYRELVDELVSRGALDGRLRTAATSAKPAGEPVETSGEPLVWVVCETTSGALARVSAELIAAGRELASTLGCTVAALVVGSGTEQAVSGAAAAGADVVLLADDPRLRPYRALPAARVIADAIRAESPEVVLFGATTTGRDLAPRVAALTGTGLAADCTDLYIADWEALGITHRSLLHQVRPAMSGGVLATCVCPEARPQMATVRPGVYAPIKMFPRASCRRIEVVLRDGDEAVTVVERRTKATDIDIGEAEVIVAGGAGCSEGSWHVVEDLAAALGGKVAASRGAVEAGLAPRKMQVGQTGTTVQPRLYVACGISGALQHVVGMQRADTIVAVNRDEDAPIFRFAHYGVVGDVADVLPKLSEVLRSRSEDRWPGKTRRS